MITTSQVDTILQNIYLDVIGGQIDQTTSPFLNMIEKSAQNIYHGQVKYPTRMGISGSVGCGTEIESYPSGEDPTILNFIADLSNIFGTLTISDKALRCSNNTPADAVNLFQSELESLINSAKYNFNRMLYQNGSGKLCTVESYEDNVLTCDSVRNFTPGMIVDIYDQLDDLIMESIVITGVDYQNSTITIDAEVVEVLVDVTIYVQNSRDKELNGLEYIFDPTVADTLYGISTADYPYYAPEIVSDTSLTCDGIQSTIDLVEEKSGSIVDFIIASYDMRRKYLNHLRDIRSNVDYMNLDGGFKALSYNGVPVYADKFVSDDTMYFLNTKDYVLAQLGDWDWITGVDGHILLPAEGSPYFVAHLVKYANLLCKRPFAQSKFVITE
jgi:hypothetical protein